MKEFNYYLKSLIGLLLLSLITSIAVGVVFENSTYALITATTVMLFGFTGLVSQLFHLHNQQIP
jgi:heme/copper-type cytochrome/quinol oxidase subunit 4